MAASKSDIIFSQINKLEEQFSGKRISIKQYNIELYAAMKRMDEGKFLTHAEVVKLLL